MGCVSPLSIAVPVFEIGPLIKNRGGQGWLSG